MRTVLRTPGLITRFGLLATTLLFGQQALAVGTDAGTDVTNFATVSYSVNGQGQTPIDSNSADFVVDRIVTFTVVNQNTGSFALVEPGATGVSYYRVTNTSNSPLDFDLVAENLSGTTVNGNTDNADMASFEIRLGAVNTDSGGVLPPSPTADFIDALPEDEFIDVFVIATAPATVTNGQFANILLRAIAHDPDDAAPGYNAVPDTNLGALLAPAANTPGGIENVLDDPGINDAADNGEEEDYWGFQHSSANLAITKAAVVIDGPFAPGSLLAVPGATIEYTITIVNNGSADATGISITDNIDTDVTFVTDAYDADAGFAANVELVVGATTTYCLAETGADANTDGCSFAAPTLTIAGSDATTSPVTTAINVAAGETMEISFQVFIPDTP